MKKSIIIIILLLLIGLNSFAQKFKNAPVDSNYILLNSINDLEIVNGAVKVSNSYEITGAWNMTARVQCPKVWEQIKKDIGTELKK